MIFLETDKKKLLIGDFAGKIEYKKEANHARDVAGEIEYHVDDLSEYIKYVNQPQLFRRIINLIRRTNIFLNKFKIIISKDVQDFINRSSKQ